MTRAATSSELERVALLRRVLGVSAVGALAVEVGIGDDAAVLDLASRLTHGGKLVWTIDTQLDGTHFRTEWLSWEDVGWRSYMAAASDLAAMGADPAFALSALTLPASFDDEALEALARGQAAAAAVVGAPVVGGNLARGGETSVTTTLMGTTPSAVLRSAARPGDAVLLAGSVGLAGAGLAMLARESNVDALADPLATACLHAWRRPVARIVDGIAMRDVATSAVDVSDGLARDVGHIADASGVFVVLDRELLLAHVGGALDPIARMTGMSVLDFVLGGGEDYALVITAPASARVPGFVTIGAVEAARPGAHVGLRDDRGDVTPIASSGFDHFAR